MVWKSAMRFWMRRRMRLSPRMGNSRLDWGRTVLLYRYAGVSRRDTAVAVTAMGQSPEVIVECLELREVAVERRDILRAYTPEGSNFENITCTFPVSVCYVADRLEFFQRNLNLRAATRSSSLRSRVGKSSPFSMSAIYCYAYWSVHCEVSR